VEKYLPEWLRIAGTVLLLSVVGAVAGVHLALVYVDASGRHTSELAPSELLKESARQPGHTSDKDAAHKDEDDETVRKWLVTIVNRTIDDPVALFTFVLASSTIGLWIVTWRSGARQSDETRQTIVAMEGSERRQLRAYVGVTRIEFVVPHLEDLGWNVPNPPPDGYIYTELVMVTVANFGSTPAYEVRVTVNWQPFRPFGSHPAPEYVFVDYVGPLAASRSAVIDTDQEFRASITIADLTAFREAESRTSSLYVYGSILYTDVYGRRWNRTYCLVYEPWRRDGERFIPYPNGGNDETYIGERPPKMPA
jgi:hypothetical protein